MNGRTRRMARVLGGRALTGLALGRFGLAPARVRRAAMARQLRLAFEELGPSFVKVGQLVSVRPDVFSHEVVAEFSRLRDDVQPLPPGTVRRVVERELGGPLESLFASFDEVPAASASVAQVHHATLAEEVRPVFGAALPAGTEVAVKVVRPDAAALLAEDVAVARRAASLASRLGLARRFDAASLIDEFEASLRRELDLRVEGRAADRLAFDFRDDPHVVVPRIVWSRSGRSVLTMEYVHGWRLSEVESATAAGIDAHALAVHGAGAFMRQVLVHGRFHADLHQSNLLLTHDGRIAYIDLGIAGTLTAEERLAVAHVLAALVYRDPERALAWSERLGVRIPAERVPAVGTALAELMDRTLSSEAPDVRHFGVGLLRILGREHVDVPGGYSLLVRSLVTVEGVSRSLYPDIDIFETARPFVTRLLAEDLVRSGELGRRAPRAVRAALRELVS